MELDLQRVSNAIHASITNLGPHRRRLGGVGRHVRLHPASEPRVHLGQCHRRGTCENLRLDIRPLPGQRRRRRLRPRLQCRDRSLRGFPTASPAGSRVTLPFGASIRQDGTCEGIIRLPEGLPSWPSRPILGRPAEASRSAERSSWDGSWTAGRRARLAGSPPHHPRRPAPRCPDADVHGGEGGRSPLPARLAVHRHPGGTACPLTCPARRWTSTPVAILRVDRRGTSIDRASSTIRYFIVWLLFIGAAFGGVVLLVHREHGPLTPPAPERQACSPSAPAGTPRGGSPPRAPTRSPTSAPRSMACSTPWQRSTEELRDERARNEAFLDAVPDMIFRVTRDGTILDARSPRRSCRSWRRRTTSWARTPSRSSPCTPSSPPSISTSPLRHGGRAGHGRPPDPGVPRGCGDGTRHFEERFVASERERGHRARARRDRPEAGGGGAAARKCC